MPQIESDSEIVEQVVARSCQQPCADCQTNNGFPVSFDRRFWAFVLPADLSNELHRTAELQQLSVPAFLFAAFYELLCRWQASTTVEFRFANALPRRAHLDNRLSVVEAVRLLQRAAQECVALPESEVANVDGQFSFEDNNDRITPPELSGSVRPLHLAIHRAGAVLAGRIDYDSTVWDQPAIERLARHYEHVLCSALSHLSSPLAKLEILGESDIRTFDNWNDTACRYPELPVDALFQQQTERTPDRPALTFEGKTLTYRTLSHQTEQLAFRLQSLGVGPGTVVAVCMDRSNEMVVALLAIFRAGGAYLPLDPGFPPDRIALMQEDAQPAVVITQSHLRRNFAATSAHVLCFDSEAALEGCQQAAVVANRSLDDLAYVLYTSGSTGRPKGVPISQRALSNLLLAVTPQLDLGVADVFLATSTISFDISAFELFAPLMVGAHLVVAPRTVAMDGGLLADAVRISGATVLQATPSGWRILLEAGWQGQPGLKMLTAGESLDRTLARRLLERGAGLWNLYGPTEATIYATGCRVTQVETKITVGRPLANYTAYVLDKNRKRIPVGAIGELYLGGIGVTRGYLNRPDLTAEKFVSNPFSNGVESRLYRSGDLARFLDDGQIELLGRADNQVKLRGYRIELEEIEALLDSHPSVRKSVVKVFDLDEGDQRLVAYVVPKDGGSVDPTQLREFAFRALPSYMIPGLFVAAQAFALTPNGKVDRKALPRPAGLQGDTIPVKAENLSEDAGGQDVMLACWRSVLLVPDLDLDFNFFEMGGHSLLAARLFAKISVEMGIKLPIGLLVEAPTPRLLSERIRQLQTTPIRCLVPMQMQGKRAPLYIIHHLLGDILLYRTLADRFAPDRPVIGVQAPSDLTHRSERYTLEALAAKYVDEILEQQTEGPFHLAGFSSGSTLAFEMARQLIQKGHSVGMLALIDGDIDGPRPPLSRAARYRKVFARKVCKIAFKLKDELKESPQQFFGKRLRFLHLLWKMRTLQAAYETGEISDLTIEQALALAEQNYRPQSYSGSALLLRFHDEAWQYGPDPLMGWSELIRGGISVVDLPGGHMTGMGSSRAPHTASVLTAHMAQAEASLSASSRFEFASADPQPLQAGFSAEDERAGTATVVADSSLHRWKRRMGLPVTAGNAGASHR